MSDEMLHKMMYCYTKRCYETRNDAVKAEANLRGNTDGSRAPYRCSDCGYWHLTTRGKMAKKYKAKNRHIVEDVINESDIDKEKTKKALKNGHIIIRNN